MTDDRKRAKGRSKLQGSDCMPGAGSYKEWKMCQTNQRSGGKEMMRTNRSRRNRSLVLFVLLELVVLGLIWSPRASSQSAKAEWEKTLAAAKTQGKVMVAGPPGETYREALTAFQKAYPGIQVDYVGTQGRDFAPRIMQERRVGQYLWDVNVGGGATMFNVLMPAKALDPLRQALVPPDLVQDKTWRGGFDEGWVDLEKIYLRLCELCAARCLHQPRRRARIGI